MAGTATNEPQTPRGRTRRVISSVPPSAPSQPATSRGVGAALLVDEHAQRRRGRQRLVRRSIMVARVAALALGIAALPVLAHGPPEQLSWLLMATIAMTVLRTLRPASGALDQFTDTAIVCAVLVLSDGMVGPFALFAAATALSLGAAVGISGGIVSASFLVLAGVLGLDLLEVITQTDGVTTVTGWVSLYPVCALLGGLSGHALTDSRTGQAMLLEANRVLASLERLATLAPETLSPSRVANAAAAQFRQTLHADVALILFEREGTLLELGRDGEVDAGPHLVIDANWEALVAPTGPRRIGPDELPARLARHVGMLTAWYAIPLRSRDSRPGVALVGGAHREQTRGVRAALGDLADETAVALDNTQLFARVEHAAAVAERERLARDLHDGVAQQLTHVRFELELLARDAREPATRAELSRLSRVASRATDDVRSAIRGLRAQALDEGLVPALRSLVADLHGGSGPTIELDVLGAAELDPDTSAEVYRIVQEALSNALRHARAKIITLSMDVIESTLVIVLHDDGQGMATSGSDDGDGLGLRTMQARAHRIGAAFSVDLGDEGGVRVEVRLPLTLETT